MAVDPGSQSLVVVDRGNQHLVDAVGSRHLVAVDRGSQHLVAVAGIQNLAAVVHTQPLEAVQDTVPVSVRPGSQIQVVAAVVPEGLQDNHPMVVVTENMVAVPVHRAGLRCHLDRDKAAAPSSYR